MLKTKSVIAVLVAVITFIIYLPALQNEFVWDDEVYILKNLFIRTINTTLFKSVFLRFHAANWHPLTWISHALDYAIWGLNPLGHHLTNNILHALNTFLVVLLVARLIETARHDSRFIYHDSHLGKSGTSLGAGQSRIYDPHSRLRNSGTVPGPQRPDFPRDVRDSRFTLIAAATTGLLFGLHPLHVESVAWVSERKDLLCAFFFLLSIMMYLKYAGRRMNTAVNYTPSPQSPPLSALRRIRRGEKGGVGKGGATAAGGHGPLSRRERGKNYLLTLLFFILALMSKPMAVTLPFVLLILDWYPFRRTDSLKTFRTAFIEKIPFLVLSLISSILTILAQKAGGALLSVEDVPLASRLIVAAKALIVYLVKILLPFHLIPFYPYPNDISFVSFEHMTAIIIVMAITATCIAVMRKQKLWMSVWGYYVLTLIPVLGIVQVGGQSMADRYTYLPSIGPFLILGLIAAGVYDKITVLGRLRMISQIAGLFIALVALVSISYAASRQIRIWKNGIVLWEYVIYKEATKVPYAYINLGAAYSSKGQIDMAIEQYQTALRLKPDYADAHNNLGLIYGQKGMIDQAIRHLEIAINLNPNNYDAHLSLGTAFYIMRKFDEAIEQYQVVLVLDPNNVKAHSNLGLSYAAKGSLDSAIEHMEAALRLDPKNEKLRNELAMIYTLKNNR